MAVAGDVLIELHMHKAVILKHMHLPGLALARFQEAQRLGDRHLIDEDLPFLEGSFGDAVARLDDGRGGRPS